MTIFNFHQGSATVDRAVASDTRRPRLKSCYLGTYRKDSTKEKMIGVVHFYSTLSIQKVHSTVVVVVVAIVGPQQ